MKDIQTLLAGTPLFRDVDLSPIAPYLSDWLRVYPDKHVLFDQGQPSNYLVVILHGAVSIISEDTHIRSRHAPDIIGEIAICGGAPHRTATVVASGSVQVLEIPYVSLEGLNSQFAFTRNLLAVVSGKLAEATSERAVHYSNENKLIAAFSSHLSPALTAELLLSGQTFGAPRSIRGTILFADVRDFTDKSQHLLPKELARQLGAYLEAMVDILHEHGAFVDKFIGDAVMAFWGLPRHSEMDPTTAFSCAEKMAAHCSAFRLAGDPIQIGVGLAMGDIFCGNVGSALKKQFTVLGPAVNLAARCEAKCKELNASIVVSDGIYNNLSETQKTRCASRTSNVKGIGDLLLHFVPKL
jgi:class 3 adenylate cyclase